MWGGRREGYRHEGKAQTSREKEISETRKRIRRIKEVQLLEWMGVGTISGQIFEQE